MTSASTTRTSPSPSDTKQNASAATVPSIPPSATLLSGATSGLVSCVLLQPLDLLKTRLQQANSESVPIGNKTKRLRLTIGNVIEKDGIKGLWRGTLPTILRNVPGVAMYFYSVTELRGMLAMRPIPGLSTPNTISHDTSNLASTSSLSAQSLPAKPTWTGNLLAGATARVAVGFILCPITVVKARFESSNFTHAQNSTLLRSISSIYSESGIKGLFRGFTVTSLRDAPYAGLYIMFYESIKSHSTSILGTEEWKSRIIAGLSAGTLSTLCTHPFDILKTKLQTHNDQSISLARTIQEIRKSGRVSSLFLDGLGLRCARKAASSAIGWGIFEGGRDLYVKNQIRKIQSQQGQETSVNS
ncbi:unnamed protein product [Sympodiomycopsis kandeliae]